MKKFYLLLKKNLNFILIFTVVVILIIEGFFWYTSGGYDASLSLFIFSKADAPAAATSAAAIAGDQFDGYWSIKAADGFSDTVVQWTKSPEIVNAVYQKAGVMPPKNSLQAFYRSIHAQKMAPQYVDVKFNFLEKEQGQKMAKALAEILQQKAELASKYSGGTFTILSNDAVIAKNQANFLLDGILALIGGVLISILIVLLKEAEIYDDRR